MKQQGKTFSRTKKGILCGISLPVEYYPCGNKIGPHFDILFQGTGLPIGLWTPEGDGTHQVAYLIVVIRGGWDLDFYCFYIGFLSL